MGWNQAVASFQVAWNGCQVLEVERGNGTFLVSILSSPQVLISWVFVPSLSAGQPAADDNMISVGEGDGLGGDAGLAGWKPSWSCPYSVSVPHLSRIMA